MLLNERANTTVLNQLGALVAIKRLMPENVIAKRAVLDVIGPIYNRGDVFTARFDQSCQSLAFVHHLTARIHRQR